MAHLRTKETAQKYEEYIKKGLLDQGCNLCLAPSIKEFRYWRIINNTFPYDRIAEIHHMIIPKRCIVESELSEDEVQELRKLKTKQINNDYEFIMEATKKKKSIPGHLHFHLIVVKD